MIVSTRILINLPTLKPSKPSCSKAVSPDARCSCGFWGVKGLADLLPLFARNSIFGQVALWGKVIEYKKGYRAQYMYPLRLYCSRKTVSLVLKVVPKWRVEALIGNLSRIYGVPIETDEERFLSRDRIGLK